MIAIKCSKLKGVWLQISTLICILIGYLIGSSLRRLYELQTISLDLGFENPIFSSSQNNFMNSRNLSKIYIAPNPCEGGRLSQQVVKGASDFSLHFSAGNETVMKPKYLLTLAVGIQQKDTVNKTVSKFSEEFAIILFHYDGRTSEWDEFEWSQRAIHISALQQTKWWYAKRFLHPEIVDQYEYIFMWDEDLGVDDFNGEEYMKLVKKYDLEISQPAITSETETPWKVTLKRDNVEVHKRAVESPQKCVNPFLPPCAGFVEIMAPVFSRKSWKCVWKIIQNDLVHGWGLDFAFWRCVEKPEENIGIVDAQWIKHLVFPTLEDRDKSMNTTSPRIWIRARSFTEWKEFERRMKEAEKQQNGSTTDQFSENEYAEIALKKFEYGQLQN